MLETRSPQEITDLLNDFFARMDEEITTNQGVIDKFIGDAVMAVFPAGESGPRSAVCAAMAMQTALSTIPPRTLADNEIFPLQIGIGIATGQVLSGQVGSRSGRQDFTVIGDPVNLAARLEALARKMEPCRILIDETTAKALPPEISLAFSGEVPVKGKTDPVKVFYPLKGEGT